MHWRHSSTLLMCLLIGLSAASCTYESPTFEKASCKNEQEGTVRSDDGAVCTDGWWIYTPNHDAGDLDGAIEHDVEIDVEGDTGPVLNVCGGVEVLQKKPGDSCGMCNLGKLTCDVNAKTLECIDDTENCPPTFVRIEETDKDEAKVTLHATITVLDPTDPPIEYGFCWFLESDPEDSLQCEKVDGLDSAAVDTKFELLIDTLPGRKYHAETYYITESKADEKMRSEQSDEFTTFAPAPTNLKASSDSSDHVKLTWEPVAHATGFEIYRDGKLLEDLSQTLNGDAIRADDTTAVGGTLFFASAPTAVSQFDFVELQSGAATLSDGPQKYTYTVVAQYPDADSLKSDPDDDGQLKIGEITYQWMGSNSGNDNQFIPLENATSLAFNDNKAPVDNSVRNYYLVATAAGATQAKSNTIQGKRKELPAPAQINATSDKPEAVTVSWNEVSGADYYSVYRDDNPTPIATDITVLNYSDIDANMPDISNKTLELLASTSLSKHVELNWEHVGDAKGTTHTYKVVAHRNSNGEMKSKPGSKASGHRLYKWIGYELKKADDAWQPIANFRIEATQYFYDDSSAGPPTITGGEIQKGRVANDHISLEIVTDPIKQDGPTIPYCLRAQYNNGPQSTDTIAGTESNKANGKRTLLNDTLEWQSAATQHGPYDAARAPNNNKTYSAPLNRQMRYYRVKFSADDIADHYTNIIEVP